MGQIDQRGDIDDLGGLGRAGKDLNYTPTLSLGRVSAVVTKPRTVYIGARMLSFDAATSSLVSEQISLVIGANFLISFQERPGDVLEPEHGIAAIGSGGNYALAAARAHNRMNADFCSVDKRLLATGYVPLLDIEAAPEVAQEALQRDLLGRGSAQDEQVAAEAES